MNRLPYYNSLELHELPSDFVSVINYRMYLDSVDQALLCYSNVLQPSGYIIHSPDEFKKWVDWAKNQDTTQQTNRISPLGTSEYVRDFNEFLEKI